MSAALRASDDVDADLAAILSDHLLTVTPHANVVANAKAVILELALSEQGQPRSRPMADPTLLHSLTLEGFRAYLQSKTFDFSKKPSLAIFAPNGLGKSSVIDALEFLFSEHGTLNGSGSAH